MPRTYDHVWQRARLVVLDRDGHLCQVGLPGCTFRATHVDHILPVSEGGARLDPGNLRASCQHCNLSRNASRAGVLSAAFDRSSDGPSRRW